MNLDNIGIDAFLSNYSNMSVSIVMDGSADLVLKGKFDFTAKFKDEPETSDNYLLEIRVPKNFPTDIPIVKELDNKIPRDGKHHVNPDETLCLGSPLRLKMILSEEPTLSGFASNCIIPYLYWITSKKFGVGELAHGKNGMVADYLKIFKLENEANVLSAIKLLGIKKRIANKYKCPCGCGLKLGKCNFRKILNSYRKIAPLHWHRLHFNYLTK